MTVQAKAHWPYWVLEAFLNDGRGVRFYGAPFHPRRWRGEGKGVVREGSDGRRRRVRTYQWPLGLIHLTERWDKP